MNVIKTVEECDVESARGSPLDLPPIRSCSTSFDATFIPVTSKAGLVDDVSGLCKSQRSGRDISKFALDRLQQPEFAKISSDAGMLSSLRGTATPTANVHKKPSTQRS